MSIFDKLKNAAKEAVSGSEKETFVFQALPESVEELKALPEAALDTPFKAAALTVCALCAYAAEPQIGIDMLNFLRGPRPLSTTDIQFLRDRFADGQTYVPFSYFAGAKPENDYTPSEPFTVTVFADSYTYQNEGYAKLNIASGGADSPRQVTLRKKGDGTWCLWEQFLTVGIRKPKSQDPWA
ncbi:MAG: hypothetical protein J6X30_03590 [Clostridia bacterium]|nr:hypothetical protein [Clostridia bacterium]